LARQQSAPAALARRRVLAGGLAGAATLALAGCHPSLPGASANGASPTPRVIDGALAAALTLLGQFDAAIAAQPSLSARLTPLRADHWTHVTALAKAAGRSVPSAAPASPSASPSAATGFDTPAATLRTLRAAEKSAQADAVQACLSAPGENAELLGSIAACRATHVELLT
jgi:hypothetical protein